ncbi:YigZ family protein [Lewinellaceae bacterium SD302]|nr:YigZ family protein [Lewinellaceae bacterium SD302]
MDTPSEDKYRIITAPGTGEFKDRSSKFIGFAHPARTEAEALNWVEHYQKLHHKARHWCYAYRLGNDGNRFRANDDGEPSGTGGKPILGQIDKLGVSDTVVVVVRYYGGVKLGTSGLINAYREGAVLALADATVGERYLTHRLVVNFGYELMGKVMSALSSLELEMAENDFGATPSLIIEVPRSEALATRRRLLAAIGEVYLEEVDEEFAVEGLDIVIG